MLLIRKLQNVLMINVFVLVGLLLMVSTCLAQNGTWNQKANIPTARWGASSCELDGKIYVIGGTISLSTSLKVMEVYDPAIDTWDITKTNMPTNRTELCVAAINGKIYAIGGATSHQGTALGVVEEYDPSTDAWVTKAPMLTARKGAACVVINNKIYVAGGSATTFTPSNILEVYNPATDTWTQKANMPSARYYPQGAVLNDTFYVSGGLLGSPWTGQTAVQVYDPAENTWSAGTDLTTGRVGHTTNSMNGKIYAIGGDKQPPVLEIVEEYDPLAETWTLIDPTPSAMISHTSSVYDDEIFVFSGSTTNIHDLTLTSNVYSYTPPPPVSIPDTSFLYALIEQGVDTNGDSVISYSEAEAITYLDVSGSWENPGEIADLTGIESFVNLEGLYCTYNNLTSMDISKNTAIIELFCHSNQLTSLDVSNNTALRCFGCAGNQLTSLDVTNNIALTHLDCGLNLLTSLDISNNVALGLDGCWANFLNISGMPSLYEVCVWDAFSLDSLVVDDSGSSNVCFETDCSGECGDEPSDISDCDRTRQLFFPNPTNTFLFIENLISDQYHIEITSMNGQLIYRTEMEGSTHQIDLSSFQKGIYFITVSSRDQIWTEKIIKL